MIKIDFFGDVIGRIRMGPAPVYNAFELSKPLPCHPGRNQERESIESCRMVIRFEIGISFVGHIGLLT